MDSRATQDQGSSLATASVHASKSGKASGRRSCCVFWLGGECYALDVGHVGELISVETVTNVPLSPQSVLGLFNLRGTAIAIVDLSTTLELGSGHERKQRKSVVVLRFDDGLTVGAPIDGVEAIVAYDEDKFAPTKNQSEHPAVQGIVDFGHVKKGLTASLLDTAVLKQRLDALKFVSRQAEKQ